MSNNNSETPDYRGSQNSQMEATNNKSYSTVLTQTKYPSKNQAIIFPAIEDAKLQDYLLPLGEILEPKNIIYASRLSNSRICMYLTSQTIVDKFMNEHKGIIKINENIIQARRYVTPSERIVLSNVCPSIPNDILVKEMENIGIIPLSPMTHLRINASLPEFSHILSFRRQIFINPPNITIPESILVTHEDTSYRIFLACDTTCYKCKQNGHIATNCTFIPTDPKIPNVAETVPIEQPIHPPEVNTPLTTTISEIPPTTSHISSTSTTAPQQRMHTSNILSDLNPTPTRPKRIFEETITPPNPEEQKTIEFKKPKESAANPKKKINLENNPQISLKEFINNQNPPMILDFNQITDLLENVKGSPDSINIVKNYTENMTDLIDMLTKIYPYLQERSLKTRSTKLRKTLLKHLEIQLSGISDDESDCSQSN